MTRFGMLIDVTRCSGCHNCFLACRDEHFGNDYPGYSAAQPKDGQFWLQVKEVERGRYPRPRLDYIAIPCQHCENAPCIDAATDGAVYRREDGIVLIDPEKAKGQEQIVSACPYRVIFWNADLQLPQKCGFCAHRLDEGEKQPRCAESCPTGAMVFGDLDDPASEISLRLQGAQGQDVNPRGPRIVNPEVYHPEYQTSPRVLYAGLPGPSMIAGEVVLDDADEVCAAGVKVTLEGRDGAAEAGSVEAATAGAATAEATTNTYGEFAFEDVEKNAAYKVTVSHPGYTTQVFDVTTRSDVDLGEIRLKK